MMRYCKVGVLGLLSVVLIACGGSEEVDDIQHDGTKIIGDIKGAEGQSVNLWVFEAEGERKIDSAVVKDGSFEIWTESKELREYVIEVGPQQNSLSMPLNNLIYLFADESASEITIEGSFPSIGDNYTVSGDQNSEDFKAYLLEMEPYNSEIAVLRASYQTTKDKKFMEQMDSIQGNKRDYIVTFIEEKPHSPVAWVMLQEFYPISGMANFDSTDLGYFEKVSIAMAEKYPYSDYPSFIDQSIDNTLDQMAQMNVSETGGDLAPDLAYNNPDGKEMKLSSLRGKVVLLDFWASWCGPCRQENPNVVKTYEKYKDKGFTVYSVSLDQDKGKWIQAIENDNLSWPNHVSDLKGWSSEAAAIYGVRSIPATFLLDQEGRIIDQNLRGGLLEQRLQEILG